MKHYYTYIMSNKPRGTIYVGSTNDITRRVWEHKKSTMKNFTSKYNLHRLVYFEFFSEYHQAASRELRLKNWHRQWKIELIEKINPHWDDLYQKVCSLV